MCSGIILVYFLLFSTVHQRIKYLCGGNVKGSGFAPTNDPELEEVLLDLSSYDCDELVTSSLDLLTQMYFFEEELFNKAQQVYIELVYKLYDFYF